MNLQPILAPFAFLLGLLFGSFLNVCIARLPHHQSIVKPRSHCPKCQHLIRWYDNIPILSFLLLRARCRDCRHPISWRYPSVELATAAWFAYIAWHTISLSHAFSILPNPVPPEAFIDLYLNALALAILGFLLLGLAVMDCQTFRLADAFTLTGIAIALFLVCTQAIFLGPTEDQVLLRHKAPITAAMSVEKGNVFLTGPEALIGGRLVAILAVAAILLTIRKTYRLVRRREGLGLGDVKLLAMIAAFLGFWPAILALFLGVLAGSVYGIALLARRRANATSRLPLGTFLAAGGLAAAAFGPSLIAHYTALFP